MPLASYPGQTVQKGGTYRVTHYKHRDADTHMIFAVGQIFPHCRTCDDLVEYNLLPDSLIPVARKVSSQIGQLPK
jgi:hypothetical protein